MAQGYKSPGQLSEELGVSGLLSLTYFDAVRTPPTYNSAVSEDLEPQPKTAQPGC